MAKFCHNCAKEIVQGQNFCAQCGARIDCAALKTDIAANAYVFDQDITEMFFRYDGRLNRKPYFIRKLFLFIIVLICYTIGVSWAGNIKESFYLLRFEYFIALGFFLGIFLDRIKKPRPHSDSRRGLVAIGFICCIVGGYMMVRGSFMAVIALLVIISFVLGAVLGIFLDIRRLHDLGKSGWWTIIGCIPVVNFIYFLYLLFAPGTMGPNKYGSDPLGR